MKNESFYSFVSKNKSKNGEISDTEFLESKILGETGDVIQVLVVDPNLKMNFL